MFKINKKYLKRLKNSPDSFYLLFKSIYSYNGPDIKSTYNLYNELTDIINADFINSYLSSYYINDDNYTKFKNIHMYNNFYTKENTKMKINNSYVKIESDRVNNTFLLTLDNVIELFVCDFISDRYMLLEGKDSVKRKII